MSAHGASVPGAEKVQLPPGSLWAKLHIIGGIVGLAALGGAGALALGSHEAQQSFYFSFLTNFLFWLSIAIGCMFFVLIHYATRAGWSTVVRRMAEHGASTFGLFAALFLVIVVGMNDLYHHWMHAPGDKIIEGKSAYLNQDFFLIRAAVYFLTWTFLAFYFNGKSQRQDETGDFELTRRLNTRAAPAIAALALTMTFAAFDWAMSLDPHWYSTMYGVWFFAGSFLGAFSFLTIILLLMNRSGILRDIVGPEHYHDLGKYIFAFAVFWTYISFSQYFLIWYANMPEETIWYRHRAVGNWYSIGVTLAVGHFAVPFLYLMPRTIKRIPLALLAGSVWVLGMHYLDIYYNVMPTLYHHGAHVGVQDLLNFVGIGGLFMAVFGWRLRQTALIPIKDPRLEESLAFENM